MTRSRFAPPLFVLLAACAPVTAELDRSVIVHSAPGIVEADAPVSLQSGQGISIVPSTEDEEWFSTLLVFDDNGEEHNDLLSAWAFLFDDGTWLYSHNGFVEISPSDPTAIAMVVDTSTNQVLDADYVTTYSMAIMVTEDYEEIGDMTPAVHDDGRGVTFYADDPDPP